MFNAARLQAFLAAATTAVLFSPVPAQAQQLEEIVVTAQRREQSLQEVPISLEAFTSAELLSEGYRTMDDLAEFSPSVEIDLRMQDQDISVRGLGSTGNSLHLEQAAPTFVDGVHFGRTSAIKGAFLDLETEQFELFSVEVRELANPREILRRRVDVDRCGEIVDRVPQLLLHP